MSSSGLVLTEEEKEQKIRFSLDDEQIAWRRWCIKNNCGGDIRKFRQEYPSTPEEAFVMTGECVFDKEMILKRISQMPEPLAVGRFEYAYDGISVSDIRFVPSEAGEIKIYEYPQKGYPYVIGGDTAGAGSDRFTAQVINNATGKQVATLCRKFDEDLYALQTYCLGAYYNDALIGIETNFSTHPVRELERLKYPRQYVREDVDSYTHGIKKSYGFVTSSKTRPLLIATLVSQIRDEIDTLSDKATARELLTFVYNENRRPEASKGAHDDLVMALGIAYFIRNHQTFSVQKPKINWTKDMREDFKNASREERQYLLKKWGAQSICK
jgi:hypothetical protein